MKVEFETARGETVTAEAQPGDNLLLVAQAAGLPLEGTCEGQIDLAPDLDGLKVRLPAESYDMSR